MDISTRAPIFGLSKGASESMSKKEVELTAEDHSETLESESPVQMKSNEFYKNEKDNNSLLCLSPNDNISSSQFTNSTIITYSILLISIAVCGLILHYLKEVLVPFVVAIFLYYLIKPLVNFITKPFNIYWFSALIPDSINDVYLGVGNDNDYNRLLDSHERREKKENGNKNNHINFMPGSKEENSLKEDPYLFRANLPWYHMELVSVCLPRILGIFLAILIILALCTAITVFIVSSINEFQTQELETYKTEANRLLNDLTTWLKNMFNLDISQLIDYIVSLIPVSTLLSNIVVYIYNLACDMFWVTLFLLYLLFEEHPDQGQSNNETQRSSMLIKDKVNEQIERYIVVKTLISLLIGILVYLILGPILNVKLSGIWGVLTFFFNYIPNVGPFLAILVSVPVIVFDASLSFVSKSLAFILPFLIHAIVGNVVEPKAFGSSLELHPIVVLLCLSIWYVLWGVPGAILSVPITAVIRIILSSLDYPVAAVLVRLLEGDIWMTSESGKKKDIYYSEVPIETELADV